MRQRPHDGIGLARRYLVVRGGLNGSLNDALNAAPYPPYLYLTLKFLYCELSNSIRNNTNTDTDTDRNTYADIETDNDTKADSDLMTYFRKANIVQILMHGLTCIKITSTIK